jgi:hypothetical protein
MPIPPGESAATGGIVVVNTEVDYRDEEDLVLVDPDEEPVPKEDDPGEAKNHDQASSDHKLNLDWCA